LVTARCAYIAAAWGLPCFNACLAACASRVTSMEAPQPKLPAGAPEAEAAPWFPPFAPFLPGAGAFAFLPFF
jgi:hypothetical protein